MRAGCFLLFACGTLIAQNTTTTTATIVGAGYATPQNFIKAAPGQVISLMVYGLDPRLDQPVTATGTPLPFTLAGFSVSFKEGNITVPVPLLGISQQPCADLYDVTAGLCQWLTVISMEVPFELQPDCRGCLRPPIPHFFVVADAGVAKTMIAALLPPDNIHITDGCDTTAPLSQTATCGKIVAHADGTRVDANHPAKVGEELVMYAFGLGRTDPLVTSGTATPNPPPQLPASQFGLNFDSTTNAAPSLPALLASPWFDYTPLPPVYVGLVPGFVGLYQANFTVPPAPAVKPYIACGGSIASNLTVTLFTTNSFDGAGICVKPQ